MGFWRKKQKEKIKDRQTLKVVIFSMLFLSLISFSFALETSKYDFDLERSVTYYPTTFEAVVGTPTSTNVTYVSYDYDDLIINVSETTGSPALDIRVNFTGVSSFNSVLLRAEYIESTTNHEVLLQIYNYNTDTWDNHYELGNSPEMLGTVPIFISDAVSHLDNGLVQIRFYHPDNGNVNDKISIDSIQLLKGTTAITSNEHDSMSGRNNESNHPWAYPRTNPDGFISSYTELDPYYFSNPSSYYNSSTLDLSDYAKYQFEDNEFNGSGNFTTKGGGRFEQGVNTFGIERIADPNCDDSNDWTISTGTPTFTDSKIVFDELTALSPNPSFSPVSTYYYVLTTNKEGSGTVQVSFGGRTTILGTGINNYFIDPTTTASLNIVAFSGANLSYISVKRIASESTFYDVNIWNDLMVNGDLDINDLTINGFLKVIGDSSRDGYYLNFTAGTTSASTTAQAGKVGQGAYLNSGKGGNGGSGGPPTDGGDGGKIEIQTGAGGNAYSFGTNGEYGILYLQEEGGYVLIGMDAPFSGGNGSSKVQIYGDVSIDGDLYTFSPNDTDYNVSRDGYDFNKLPKSDELLDENGELRDDKFEERSEYCWNEYPYNTTWCGEVNGTNQCFEVIDYLRPEEYCVLRLSITQLAFENTKRLSELRSNINLYNNLTDFDTGLMAENIYFQSKVVNASEEYALRFLNISELDNKINHKNYEKLDDVKIPKDKRDALNAEDRIVDLEGAFSDHMNCMYLHKKYDDYRDCMLSINPKVKIK